MGNLMRGKAEQRQILREARLNMPAAQVDEKSRAITERIKTILDWAQVSRVHCYEPMTIMHEVNVKPLVAWLRRQHSAVSVLAPRNEPGGWQMVPLTGTYVRGSELQFDVVIVPMLGFDDSLHRLGYGRGYYDRFLASQPTAQKIGVCFEFGHMEELPVEAHDIPMDIIVTEEDIYNRKR